MVKKYQENYAKNQGKQHDKWDDKHVSGKDRNIKGSSDNVVQRTALGYFVNLLDFLNIMDKKSDN